MVRKKPMDFVENETGCFIVTSHRLNPDGYAHFWHNGMDVRAHRLVYEECFGQIPEGWFVRHKCDTPSCINPEHLEIGTHQDNMNDKTARNRNAIGIRNGRVTINDDIARNIKLLLVEGLYPTAIAKTLGVSYRAVRGIKESNTWNHVQI